MEVAEVAEVVEVVEAAEAVAVLVAVSFFALRKPSSVHYFLLYSLTFIRQRQWRQ